MQSETLDLVVVDDNPVLVSVLTDILRECGHTVRQASDGFAALAEIGKKTPDILISDLCMPGMSGYELMSVVRRRFPSIRVIAMSGAYSGGELPEGIAADAFYAKGSSSVARLVQLVGASWQLGERPTRATAPIWISEVAADGDGASVLFVSCPECLRPFLHRQDGVNGMRNKVSCSHCRTVVDLAVVRKWHETDGTPLAVAYAEQTISQRTSSVNWTDGISAARAHRQ